MKIRPFANTTTESMLGSIRSKIINKVDSLSNEEIMGNDIEILVEKFYQDFYVEPVSIHEENFSKRNVKQDKIKRNGFIVSNYQINPYKDSVLFEFHFPFDGCDELFQCRASTYSTGSYPEIELCEDELIISMNKSIDEVNHIDINNIISEIDKSLDRVKLGIEYANNDIKTFNDGLKLFLLKQLNEKKNKVKAFFNIAEMLRIPIEKNKYSQQHIVLKRRIVPISHKYNNESYYGIDDKDYYDILDVINHTLSTYERTPSSYISMKEEDLRNTLLATLNGSYQGKANGETFRNNGKTDICIEQENRAAFVAECKMWNGKKNVENALCQLDSYLTWRDCKTALIYFVRRKNFLVILDEAKKALTNIGDMINVKEIEKNIFDCLFLSKSNLGQRVKIRVMLFNLYSDENYKKKS